MKPGPNPKSKPTATELIKEIKRRTRRLFLSEEKIRIVLEGLRGEESIAAILFRQIPGTYQLNIF